MKNLNKKLLAMLLGFVLVFTNMSNLQQAKAYEGDFQGSPEEKIAIDTVKKIISESSMLQTDEEIKTKLLKKGISDELADEMVDRYNYGYRRFKSSENEYKNIDTDVINVVGDTILADFIYDTSFDPDNFKWYISDSNIAEQLGWGVGPSDYGDFYEMNTSIKSKKSGKILVALVHQSGLLVMEPKVYEFVDETDYDRAVKEKVKSYIQERIDKKDNQDVWFSLTRVNIKENFVDGLNYDEAIINDVIENSGYDWKALALKEAKRLAGPDNYYGLFNLEHNLKQHEFTKEEIAYALENLEYDFDKIVEVKVEKYLDSGYSKALLIETFAKDYKMPEAEAKKQLKALNINWKEVALKFAKNIAIEQHYSKNLLKDILEKRLFLPEEVQYTLANINIDWDANAVGAAEAIMNSNYYNHYSRAGLVEELLDFGFTSKQAKTAVEKLNYNPKKVELIEDYSKIDHKVKVREYKTLYFNLDGYNKDEVTWYSTSQVIAHIADVMILDDFGDFIPFNIEKLEVLGRKPGFVTIAVLDENKKVIDQQTVEIIAKDSDETEDKEESNKPKEPVVIKNDKVTLETAVTTNIPNTAKLSFKDVSKKITKDTMKKFKENVNKTLVNNEIINLFDISLLVDGKELQLNGDVKVTISLNEEMKKFENLKVVYISDTNKVEEIKSEVKDGKISFITDHFSYYAVVGVSKNLDNKPNTTDDQQTVPNTGIASNIGLYSSTMMTAIAGLYVLSSKKRK